MAKVNIQVKFSGGGSPEQWVRQKVSKIESSNRESMTNAINAGKEITKEHISNRGIQKRGRIDTGEMVGAVDSVVRERTRDRWSGAFGWTSEQEDYFIYQEKGFTHVGSGEAIPAMYALHDAADEVWNELHGEIERNIRGA